MGGPCCPGKPVAKRLRIGNQMVGIAELDSIVDGALKLTGASDDEIRAILLAGLQKYNYIPVEMEDEYAKAIWEEFVRRRQKAAPCCCGKG